VAALLAGQLFALSRLDDDRARVRRIAPLSHQR
jgi:hypothetical protein